VGLWLALRDRQWHAPLWLHAALSLFGTFGGSAYLPLGVTVGGVLIARKRPLAASIVGGVPIVWFLTERVLWSITDEYGAHGIGQVLREGPDYAYHLIDKAFSDTLSVGYLTAALLVIGAAGVCGLLLPRASGQHRPTLTMISLTLALALTVLVIVVGRLNKGTAESPDGSYSYFVVAVAVPGAAIMVHHYFAGTGAGRIVALLTTALLLGVSLATSSATFASLGTWKRETGAQLQVAAGAARQGFAVVNPDVPPAPGAPTFSWNDVKAAEAAGKLDPITPNPEQLSSLSLNLQWAFPARKALPELRDCTILQPGQSAPLTSRASVVAVTSLPKFRLSYQGAASTRSVTVTSPNGLAVHSVADRDATITATTGSLRVCGG
jgi:hypothetical protein